MGDNRSYCTISTKCSQGVTHDAREHYQTQFTSKIWVWRVPKLFISGLNLGQIGRLAAQLHKNRPNQVFTTAGDPSTTSDPRVAEFVVLKCSWDKITHHDLVTDGLCRAAVNEINKNYQPWLTSELGVALSSVISTLMATVFWFQRPRNTFPL